MKLLSRISRVAAVTLAVAGLVAAPGCKKDEEPAEPTEAAGAEGEAPEAGEKGEAAEAGAEGKKEGAAAAAGATTPVVARSAPDLPDGVITVVGVPSLDNVLGSVSEVGNKVAPGQLPPDLSPLVLAQLESLFGFTTVDWLKKDAPAYVFNVDPKAHEGKGQAVVLPTSDKDAVLAALPEGASKDVDGHAAKYEHQFQTWFVDFVDGHVVLTDHTKIFGETKDFASGALAGWKPERMLSVHVNMDTIRRVFAQELEQFKQSASQFAKQAARDPSLPDTDKVMQKYVDMAYEIIDGTSRVDLAVYPEDGDINMTFNFLAASGSKLEALSRKLTSGAGELAGLVPGSTWLGVAANMDVRDMEGFKGFQQLGLQTYAKILELSPEEQAKLQGLFEEIMELSTGQSVTALYTDGKFPLAIAGLSKVTDASKAREIYGQAVELLFARIWNQAMAEMRKEGTEIPGAADVKTFDDAVKLATTFGSEMGVTLAVAHEEADGVAVDALIINANWEKLSRMGGNEAELKLAKDMVGDKLELAMGFKDDNVTFGFGPKGIEVATKLAKGEEMGGEEILGEVSKDNAFAMTIRAGAVLKALTFLPDLQAMKDKIESLPSDQAYKVTASSDGKGLAVTIGLPVDLTAGLVQLGQ